MPKNKLINLTEDYQQASDDFAIIFASLESAICRFRQCWTTSGYALRAFANLLTQLNNFRSTAIEENLESLVLRGV